MKVRRLLKAEGQPEHRTPSHCGTYDAHRVAVPIAAAVLYAHERRPHPRRLPFPRLQRRQLPRATSATGYAANTAAVGGTVLRYPGGNLADWWDARLVRTATVAAGCPECHNACKGKPRRYYSPFRAALRRADASAVLHGQHASPRTSTSSSPTSPTRRSASSWRARTWSSAASFMGPILRPMAARHRLLGGGEHVGPIKRRSQRSRDGGRRALDGVGGFSPHRARPELGAYSSVNTNVDGVTMHPYLHLGDDRAGGGPLQPGVPPRATGVRGRRGERQRERPAADAR